MNTSTHRQRALAAFRNWTSSSSVRSRPYSYLLSEDDIHDQEPTRWFPCTMAPVLTNPYIANLSNSKRLQLHQTHLVYFLDYTTDLEMNHVNKAVRSITHGKLKKFFSPESHLTALRIYTDEGYHALFSRGISHQIKSKLDIRHFKSFRLESLSRLCSELPVEKRSLARFVVAFVSETVITKELFNLTREALIPAIFHVLLDHLHDESRHSIYFSECFERLWTKVSDSEKSFISSFLLDVIFIFSRPDKKFLKEILDFNDDITYRIFSSLDESIPERASNLAEPTIQALKRTDFFKYQQNQDIYGALGFRL